MLENIINFIGQNYQNSKNIYDTILKIFAILIIYKSIYIIIGFFFTRRFKESTNYHKYAILIAARNEEKVIGNLLDSINKQDYPKELLDIFVVADNCTDKTAQIAKQNNAIVYKRFDNKNKTKGFALQYLFKQIDNDYGITSYEGYFIFDADNLLNKNYIKKMNNAFDSGEKIITSYRNTKNFDENWIASTYAIHWLRSIRTNHRARSILHLATNIQGTGFLFANEIVKNGWNYTSLTEDRALTADAVARGYQITYQDEAIFYDEQPISIKVALRQRLRWSKGHLMAFTETGPKLFINIFCGKTFIKDKWKEEPKLKPIAKLIESIRHHFASYDTLMQLIPFNLINFTLWIIISLIMYSNYSYINGINNLNILNQNINTSPGINALIMSLLATIILRIIYLTGIYISNLYMAIYIFIIERKRIKKIPLYKKILYTITWPTFDLIGRFTMYAAPFIKATWKPIPHVSKITINDINK